MDEVAESRHAGAQNIGGRESLLGERRQFKGVAVEVAKRRVNLGFIAASKASSMIFTSKSVLSSAGVISPVVVFLSQSCQA